MNHHDHVNLIKEGVNGTRWIELGSGRGAFTLALADCLGAESHITSVDIDRRALEIQQARMQSEFPDVKLTIHVGDFTQNLDLPTDVDGVLMANSLHFVYDKVPVLQMVRELLKPDAGLLLVEYDTNQGNYAVPYPITSQEWKDLAKEAGFSETRLLATRPSRFMGAFFSAISYSA